MARNEVDMEYVLLGSWPVLIKEVRDSVPIARENSDCICRWVVHPKVGGGGGYFCTNAFSRNA